MTTKKINIREICNDIFLTDNAFNDPHSQLKEIDIFRNFTKSAMVTKMQNKESIMCTHLNLVWTEGAQNIQQFGLSSPKISWVKVKLVQVYLVI